MKNRPRIYLGLGMLLGAVLLGGRDLPAQALPELKAVKTEQAPVIDGNLQDPAWKTAGIAAGFVEKHTRQAAEKQTRVYLLYDDHNLYLGFRCEEPNPTGIKTGNPEEKNERKIWAEDLIAILIEPDESQGTYYQYALSAGGMKFDQKNCAQGVFYEEYRPAWEAKIAIGKDAWQAELKIPFAAIEVQPQMGKIWRMNFCRSRSQSKEASSWSYAFNWRDPDTFGRIEGIVIGADCRGLVLEDIKLGAGKVGDNIFRAKAVNLTTTAREAQGRLIVTSAAGESNVFALPNISLPAKSGVVLEAPYQVRAEEGEHRIALELTDRQGGLLYKSPPGLVDLKGLLDCYVERSYYTREDKARIVCLIAPSIDAAVLRSARIKCELSASGIVREAGAPIGARTVLELPLAEVMPGEHGVKVVLAGANGKPMASQKLSLLKLAPGQGSEVKVVRRDQGAYLLVNEKPFFILADFLIYPRIGDTDVLKEMAESGFTTVVCWADRFDEIVKILDAAGKNGVMVAVWPAALYENYKKQVYADFALLIDRPADGSDDEPAEVQKVRARVKELQAQIRKIKDHPALLYWRNFDEPGIEHVPHCKLLTRIIREVDPYHPIEMGSDPGGSEFGSKFIAEIADIYETHTYIHGNRPMITAFERARRGKPFSDRDRKVYSSALTGNTSWSYRGLTYTEQRCETYLGVIGGWRGVKWFFGRHFYLECWENVRQVAREMSRLAPMLLAEEVEQNVKVTQPEDNPIYWTLLEYEGRRYILAANSKEKRVDSVTFNLPELKDQTPIKVWFEERELRSAGNAFTDGFDAFGAHVYEIPRK